MGRDFPAAPVRTIENDVTTQKEIFGYFGEPARKGLENGYETWTIPTSLMSLASYVTSKNFTFFSTRTIQCVTIRLTPDEPAKSVTPLTRLTYTSFLSQSIINQKNIARRQEAGIVRIQAQTIRPATFQRTERSRRTEPTPTIAPVIV
jgi:hypothetical protein